jgi:pyruvate carboxylase
MTAIRRLLVANRSEIAIRIFRAATELNIETIAVYAEQDKLSLHRFKADEAYQIGRGPHLERPLGPIEAYLSISEILRISQEAQADAIHPGYGFLSESPELARACRENSLIFIGPSEDTLTTLGNKVSARQVAMACNVPVVPASGPLPRDDAGSLEAAKTIGLPVMLKASWGGGGRGMRIIDSEDEVQSSVQAARREAKAAFGKDDIYFEKLIRQARHVEVQILGDQHGNRVHLFERDCSIQRRNQKVIERAPASYLSSQTRQDICAAALRLAEETNYIGAGTVEFLMDAATSSFYFIEVNPRIQVEHTVTEEVTGLDIVKAQIRIAEGGRIGDTDVTGIPSQDQIKLFGHALQCRVTTESPDNNFMPDYGRITAYRGAMGFGIRVDGGTAYSGAVVTRFYDPLLEKVTAWGATPEETISRMMRALKEYRIRGVSTNLSFLQAILSHPKFLSNEATTRFIDETPELFDLPERQDRATKLLSWIADVSVNGHPETRDRPKPKILHAPNLPVTSPPAVEGTRQRLQKLGPAKFARWMQDERRVLVTDTTMRDAHQSLLATRFRTKDIAEIAPAYASLLPGLLSLECWGGATFDVAMRFLSEDPWDRLSQIRKRTPNILTQMLLRGANGVGYTNYPDNVVQYFVRRAADAGVDLFRVFDCLNWVEQMRVSIDTILETDKLCEGAICYTGNLLDSARPKYDLAYYVGLAKQLESAGVHILAIKDMAGLLKPAAARTLIAALKDAVDLPLHLHTHDTSGLSGATVIAAVEAGVDAVDAAMDAMSGTTSQPSLGSIVAALEDSDRATGLSPEAIRKISYYWESVRHQYAAFESDLKGGASEVYLHEMPGGQFTNLKEQARSIGLADRWHEVAEAYHAANNLFGDIVKVTPSSKVVGDMALMMVSQGLTAEDVLDDSKDVAFPASVVEMMHGDLGQPPGGWPSHLQKRILQDKTPITVRPGSLLQDIDLEAERQAAQKACGCDVNDNDLASHLMYPKIFKAYAAIRRDYGPISVLPTDVFFYGMEPGQEMTVELEAGKALVIVLQTIAETNDEGKVRVFFELNGQPRVVTVADRAVSDTRQSRPKADTGNELHIAAPFPGTVSTVAVEKGQHVRSGDVLLSLEAMKMETVLRATKSATVQEVLVTPGNLVEAKDLLVILE